LKPGPARLSYREMLRLADRTTAVLLAAAAAAVLLAAAAAIGPAALLALA
jgi:hypothetical protein